MNYSTAKTIAKIKGLRVMLFGCPDRALHRFSRFYLVVLSGKKAMKKIKTFTTKLVQISLAELFLLPVADILALLVRDPLTEAHTSYMRKRPGSPLRCRTGRWSKYSDQLWVGWLSVVDLCVRGCLGVGEKSRNSIRGIFDLQKSEGDL